MAHQPDAARPTSKVVRSSDATLARWRLCFCLRTAAEQRKTNGWQTEPAPTTSCTATCNRLKERRRKAAHLRQREGRVQSRHDQPGNRTVSRPCSNRDFSGVASSRTGSRQRQDHGKVKLSEPYARACARGLQVTTSHRHRLSGRARVRARASVCIGAEWGRVESWGRQGR